MNMYNRFKSLDIDCSAIGFEQNENYVEYFCTPKDAQIIGCAGVDGIHYCFIKGFGETVFAVSPSNLPGDYVHPLARNFEDFIRLVLSCGDLAAVEQAHAFSKKQFNEFIKANQPTVEQASLLKTLADKLSLTPIDRPFDYIKQLQQLFDYSEIKYNAEYYEIVDDDTSTFTSEWKVYFDGGFFVNRSRSRAGTEISINKYFQWGDKTLYVPAVYSCAKGIVVDICVKVDTLQFQSYIDKWMPLLQNEDSMSDEQISQAESENPLNFDFFTKVEVNGKMLCNYRGCSISWLPESCMPEETENDKEAKAVLEHYGMDLNCGWTVHRLSFSWKTNRRPNIKSIKLNLEKPPVLINGLHFKNPKLGDIINFVHPVSGVNHILTVCGYEKDTLDFAAKELSDYDFPKYNTVMTYTITPELSDAKFHVCDCLHNDTPRYIGVQSEGNASSIGIIGGADGPTAIFAAHKSDNKLHSACSALRFEPTDDVEWKMVFREKMCEDIEVCIL